MSKLRGLRHKGPNRALQSSQSIGGRDSTKSVYSPVNFIGGRDSTKSVYSPVNL